LDNLKKRLQDFININLDDSILKNKYTINESKDWVLNKQRKILREDNNFLNNITLTSYRPFDNQFAILHTAICDRPRKEILQHILKKENYCLLNSKQQATEGFRHTFITKLPANDCVMSTTSREANQIFPLYIYTDSNNPELKNI
jgi:predicted helicase